MTVKTLYRAVAAVLTWATLSLQYGMNVFGDWHATLLAATLSFFGYFTILTVLLCGLAFTAPLLKRGSPIRVFFERPGVRAALALYIFVVAVVYHVALAHLWEPTGWVKVTDILFHTIIPILYILDWIFFAEKSPLFFKHLWLWPAYPLAFGLWTILKGEWIGFYPYPFMDVGQLGYTQVLINMGGFLVFYLVAGAVMIGVVRVARP